MRVRIALVTEVYDAMGRLATSVTTAAEDDFGDNAKFIRENWASSEERGRLMARHLDQVAAGLGER